MPIFDIEPGQSPETTGTLSFYNQGQAASTGVVMTSDGNLTMAGNLAVSGTITGNDVTPAWFNVKAYGAVGNGTTDDTAAIQAAIDAVPSTGGVVYIPAGTYKLTAAINLKSELMVIGDGMLTTQLHQTSTTANGLQVIADGPRYISIQDMRVTGPNSGSGQGIHIETTTSTASASINLSRLYVDVFGGDGVNSDTCITSTWQDVRVSGCGGFGFNLFSGTSMTLISCYAVSCVGGGYNLNAVGYSSLIGCACDSVTGDGYTTSGTTTSFISCGWEAGIGNAFKVTGGSNHSLVDCYTNGNNAIGLWVTNASSRIFINNFREINPTGSATASIQVDSGCTATVIQYTINTAVSFAANTTKRIQDSNAYFTANGTMAVNADRTSAASTFANFIVSTAGTDRWAMGLRNDSTNDLHVFDSNNGINSAIFETRPTQSNIQLLSGTKDFGSGAGVISIANRTTAPTASAAAGAIIYADTQRLATFNPLAVTKAGAGLQIKEGSNACMGTATLNGITEVTVSTTAVTASSRIFITVESPGGTVGGVAYVSSRVAGTSFGIKGIAVGDTSTVAWLIVEPA